MILIYIFPSFGSTNTMSSLCSQMPLLSLNHMANIKMGPLPKRKTVGDMASENYKTLYQICLLHNKKIQEMLEHKGIICHRNTTIIRNENDNDNDNDKEKEDFYFTIHLMKMSIESAHNYTYKMHIMTPINKIGELKIGKFFSKVMLTYNDHPLYKPKYGFNKQGSRYFHSFRELLSLLRIFGEYRVNHFNEEPTYEIDKLDDGEIPDNGEYQLLNYNPLIDRTPFDKSKFINGKNPFHNIKL